MQQLAEWNPAHPPGRRAVPGRSTLRKGESLTNQTEEGRDHLVAPNNLGAIAACLPSYSVSLLHLCRPPVHEPIQSRLARVSDPGNSFGFLGLPVQFHMNALSDSLH